MEEVSAAIIISRLSKIDEMQKKKAIQSIAKNFNTENLMEIEKLSYLDNANERIQDLFKNPFFKMAIK